MFELLIKLIQTSYMENKQPFYLLITMWDLYMGIFDFEYHW